MAEGFMEVYQIDFGVLYLHINIVKSIKLILKSISLLLIT